MLKTTILVNARTPCSFVIEVSIAITPGQLLITMYILLITILKVLLS